VANVILLFIVWFKLLYLQNCSPNKQFKTDKKQLAVFTSFNILANRFLPLNMGVMCFYIMDEIQIENVKYIADLALIREANSITHNQLVELFDSIDCLTLDELSILFAVFCVGKSGEVTKYSIYLTQALNLGFPLVDELFNNLQLGVLLTNGLKELGAINT
jgi:hypothetical protein